MFINAYSLVVLQCFTVTKKGTTYSKKQKLFVRPTKLTALLPLLVNLGDGLEYSLESGKEQLDFADLRKLCFAIRLTAKRFTPE